VEKNKLGTWQITDVSHLGWAEKQGIKVGDTVSLINGIQPSKYITVRQYGVIEQAKTLVINKNGELILYKVTDIMTPVQVQYQIIIPIIVFAILVAFSYFLYIKKSDDPSATVLILFFLAIGLSYLSADTSSRINILGIYVNRIAFSLIPVLFLEFLFNYFKQFGLFLYNRKYILALYLSNGVLLVISIFLQIFGGSLSIIRDSFLGIFLISIILCFYFLISCYFRYRNTIHKPFLKILITGFIIAFFPFIFLVGFPSILFGVELIPGAIAAVFLIFLPVVFLYLMTAKRLFDIDFIIDRIRYFSIISLIPTVLCVLFIFYFIKEFSLIKWIQVGLIIYVGIIGFLYIKEELDYRFRPKLFIEKNNFQASLERFTQNIARVMKKAELEERLIMEIKEVLSVKSVSLLEIDLADKTLSIKTGSACLPDKDTIDGLKNNIISILVGELIDIDSGVLLIVSKEKDKSNLLWIRGRLNRTQFNLDERVWLKTIAFYVSVVYENLELIEGLINKLEEAISQKDSAQPWVSRLLFNIAEKERRRLASDLHDSALQQQLLCYRNLETLLAHERIPDDLRKEFNNIAEGLLDVVHQIRETCNELFPPLLKELGIIEALKNLFTVAQLRMDYVVNFKATGFNVDLGYEYVLALYRIVQELLINAGKHSKATEINITLAVTNGILTLNYRDNGIGIDLQNLQFSINHMGLSGIKERVLSLGGNTNFNSSLGEGFEVVIQMALDMNLNVNEQVV
jgi:two-component system sensor histidine kinase ComP